MESDRPKEIIKLKAAVVDAIRTTMQRSGATESFYDKITGGTGACENVPTAFMLHNAAELSYLSQTDQLQMEREVIECGLPAVWTLGRSFRNEPRVGDGRHLAEFALLEYEARGMDLTALIAFQQELLLVAMEVALESPIIPDDHKGRLKKFIETPAPVISYTEIVEKLASRGVSINWGDDFSSKDEEMICVLEDGPVQVTRYPESIKFFNMFRTNRDPRVNDAITSIAEANKHRWTVECVDFLLPWAGETFGASQREENHDWLYTKLQESIMFKQMVDIRQQYYTEQGGELAETTPEQVKADAWRPFISYLRLFVDNKDVTRSGFGLGMGRLIQFLLGSTSIIAF